MIVYDGPVLPDDLTTYVRGVPQPANFVLNQILPDVYIQDNKVDVGQITSKNRTARFRSYDANLHVARRDTGQVQSVQLPPLSDTLAIGELERLKLEFARTGGTNQEVFVDAIYNDADTLTRYIQNRMELARGDLLTDGKFTMLGAAGEPLLESDYQVPGSNFVTPSVALWSDTVNADLIADETAWVTAYTILNGFPPGGKWISRKILNQMLANQKLRTAAGTILGASLQLTRSALDLSFSERNLVPIVGVYDSLVDVDDVPTQILPDNKVIYVPPAGQPFGRTVWGVTATSLELVGSSRTDLSFSKAPGIVGVVEKVGPPYREFTFVDAVGMPVLDNPRALMVATVSA